MTIKESYNHWAGQYDTNENKTRDLEALSLKETLAGVAFDTCLEIGCGTGKNTAWLLNKAKEVVAVDFSDEMLQKAKLKISSANVAFKQADINEEWFFADKKFNLISFSLVLEHIENLDNIFKKISDCIEVGGYVYIGELHPFKQYSGTKARFETNEGLHTLTCFTHNLSDFISAGLKYGLSVVNVKEYFDGGDETSIPRIITLLFKKK